MIDNVIARASRALADADTGQLVNGSMMGRALFGRATGEGPHEELAPTPEDLPDGGVGY